MSATVLERNPYVGGLAATFQHKGFKFDLGGHRWFTKNEDLNTWFRRLMDGEIVMVNRISRIFHGGRFFKYPIEVRDIIRNTNPFDLSRIVLSFLANSFWRTVAGTHIANIEDAYKAQFGATLYKMFFEQYTEKLWGLPCSELSADWVSQRSKGLNIWTVVQEALAARKASVKSLVEEFMYPRDGYVRIPERMAEDIRKDGNSVLLDHTVKGITWHGPHDLEVVYDRAGESSTLRVTDVVSTIPLGLLAQMIEPKPDPEVLAAARSLAFRDLITVNVKLRKKQVSRDTWLYVQDRGIIFGRLHEPKNWSKAMVPDDDHTSLVLECFCSMGDSIWSLTDDQVAERCVSDLVEKLKFVQKQEVVGWNVVRTRFAYPIYDLHYAGKVKWSRNGSERSPACISWDAEARSATTMPTIQSKWACCWVDICWARTWTTCP